MKYAKTFENIEEYNAEESTFEYPHLSYILSGETVIIDLEEEEEEEPQPEPEPQSPLQFGATDYYCSSNMNTGEETPSECITLTYNGEPVYIEIPSDTVTFGGELIDLGTVEVSVENGCAVFRSYGNATGTVTAEYMGETATTTVHAEFITPEE